MCRFHLYYFSNAALKEKKDPILDINTRGKVVVKDDNDLEENDEVGDPLEKAIQTKYCLTIPISKYDILLCRWEGAVVGWNGIPNYV